MRQVRRRAEGRPAATAGCQRYPAQPGRRRGRAASLHCPREQPPDAPHYSTERAARRPGDRLSTTCLLTWTPAVQEIAKASAHWRGGAAGHLACPWPCGVTSSARPPQPPNDPASRSRDLLPPADESSWLLRLLSALCWKCTAAKASTKPEANPSGVSRPRAHTTTGQRHAPIVTHADSPASPLGFQNAFAPSPRRT